MRRALGLLALLATPALAQAPPEPPRWFLGMDVGYGSLDLRSDQVDEFSKHALALTFRAQVRVGERIRLGLEAGGWTLDSTDVDDPSKGESVSNVLVVLDLVPEGRYRPLFRLGVGRVEYNNNAPTALEGGGWGFRAAVGWEFPVWRNVRLVPRLQYGASELDDEYGYEDVRTGRSYDAWDLGIGVTWVFRGGSRYIDAASP